MTQDATARTDLAILSANPGADLVVADMTTALFIVWETFKIMDETTLDKDFGKTIPSVILKWAVFKVKVFLCTVPGIVFTVLLDKDATRGTTTTFIITLGSSVPNTGRPGTIARSNGAMNAKVNSLHIIAGILVNILRTGPMTPSACLAVHLSKQTVESKLTGMVISTVMLVTRKALSNSGKTLKSGLPPKKGHYLPFARNL